MTEPMVTINPTRLFMTADLARIVGSQPQTARAWIRRHWHELPPPVITLNLGLGKVLYVWTEADGKTIVAKYKEAKANWPPNQWVRPAKEGDTWPQGSTFSEGEF